MGIDFILMLLFVSVILPLIVFVTKKSEDRKNARYAFSKAEYGHLYGTPPAAPPSGEQSASPEQHAPPVQKTAPVKPPAPPVPKKPFSPIPLLLIAGVLFLFLGGIIFLTGTWDMLPDLARALALLSASAVAFGINVLAERVLKLPKTGLAFYILGCIFLPLALGGIGAFSLLGEWFSFSGDGCCLLGAVMSASISATSFLGQKNYKNAVLACLGLTGLGGAWMLFCLFLLHIFELHTELHMLLLLLVFTFLLVGFAALMTYLGERCLKRHPDRDTPLSKAWIPYLWVQNAVWLLMLLVVINDEPIAGGIGAFLIALLFLNNRFLFGSFHTGVLGYAGGLMAALYAVCDPETFAFSTLFEFFIFITGGTVLLLMLTSAMPKLPQATRQTMSNAAIIASFPVILISTLSMLFGIDEQISHFFFLFIVPLGIAVFRFLLLSNKPLETDKLHLVFLAPLLFSAAMQLSEEGGRDLLRLFLIGAAVILLVYAFVSRRIWPLALSICSCLSIILHDLENGHIWILGLCAAALFGGVVYAHLTKHPTLELCCAMAGLPFLLIMFTAIGSTMVGINLAMGALTLYFLAEATVFRPHSRSRNMLPFCLDLSLVYGTYLTIIVFSEKADQLWTGIAGLLMAVLTAANLRRKNNIAAGPMFILLYLIVNRLIEGIADMHSLSDSTVTMLQLGCCALMLAVFAVMGRLLLPKGFFNKEDGRMQIDFALLAASLPIVSAARTIDWHPSILCCLLLSLYSLLYIGRTQNTSIPKLLATAFACLTVFLHNVIDPFGILESWLNADFKTPLILLYALPMHLFIACQLFILPKKHANAVHTARFIMYCITMLCIMTASLQFNRAEDGIFLAVFSLLILIGSFFVKRLRWFTLGFSVLFLMTLKLTWEFWKSLHWGIYLFLAGALLIGIAFWYEYAAKQKEKTEKKSEKPAFFKEWKW